jgi:hypothetical protein
MHDVHPDEVSAEFTQEVGARQFALAAVGMPMVVRPIAEAMNRARREPVMSARAVHISARIFLWLLVIFTLSAAGTVAGLALGIVLGGGARGAWVGIFIGHFLPWVLGVAMYFPMSRWLLERDVLGVRFTLAHRLLARMLVRSVDGFRGTRIDRLIK